MHLLSLLCEQLVKQSEGEDGWSLLLNYQIPFSLSFANISFLLFSFILIFWLVTFYISSFLFPYSSSLIFFDFVPIMRFIFFCFFLAHYFLPLPFILIDDPHYLITKSYLSLSLNISFFLFSIILKFWLIFLHSLSLLFHIIFF